MLDKGTDRKQFPAGQPRIADVCANFPTQQSKTGQNACKCTPTDHIAEQEFRKEAVAHAPSHLGGLRLMSRHPGAPSSPDPDAP